MNKHLSTEPKKTSRRRKVIVISAIVGTLAAPAVAWAAVQLFGFGTFDSAAASTQELTITVAKTANSLVPGETVGVTGQVSNPNDFPVTVTGIIIKDGSAVLTPNEPTNCKISFAPGGTTATYPAHGGAAAVPGSPAYNLAAADRVLIPAHSVRTVTVPNVIKQDATATKLCGVKADYAVSANVGS